MQFTRNDGLARLIERNAMKAYWKVKRYRGTAWQEDEMQQAWLIAYEVVAKGQLNGLVPKQQAIYIQRAVEHGLISWHRGRDLRGRTEELGVDILEETESGGQEEQVLRRQIAETMEAMPNDLKPFLEVLHMDSNRGGTYQLAKQLDMAPGTAYRKVTAAFNWLKERLT